MKTKVSIRSMRQRGAVLPLIAIGMLGVLVTAGLAIDLGHGFLNKTRLQSALDAAALSGARTLMASGNVARSSVDARAAFTRNLEGEMDGLDANNLVLQFSPTLDPFNPLGATPLFVRASFAGFETDFTLASLAPVGDFMDIGGTAVAGPIPVGTGGTETCDLFPVLMCGVDNGDADCTPELGDGPDGPECFGMSSGTGNEYQLKTGSGTFPEPGTVIKCKGEDDVIAPETCYCNEARFPGCRYDESGDVGPGNFQLIRVNGNGANVLRENLAGSDGSCLADSSSVETEPGNTVGPVEQGLNTRFGIYSGGMKRVDWKPDVVTTDRYDNVDYWYEDYKLDVEYAIAAGNIGDTIPYKRVVPVPVVECDPVYNGQSTIPTIGIACFFLTRHINETGAKGSYIYGELLSEIAGCEAGGEVGDQDPGPVTNYGPSKIVLYNDPNSQDS